MVVVGWLLLFIVVDTIAYGVGEAKGYPEDADGFIDFGPVVGTALDLGYLAIAIPVVLLTVRWVGRRPAGTVSSVDGRLRKGWLTLCVLMAVPVCVLGMAGMLLMPGDEISGAGDDVWVGLQQFLPILAMLLVLVPLQAAAEEYVFRGWLLQAVGGFFRSPWVAVLPQAVLFAAAHGWGTPAGFIDLVIFGAVAGWLTVRTGGLEAAIALHAVNNLAAFALGAAVVGGLESDETAADAPWQLVVLDTTVTLLYAAAVLWFARRRWPNGAFSSPTAGIAHPADAFPLPHEHAHPQTARYAADGTRP
jgi:membrane protease YdiL (CAAX protease family)